MRLRARARVCAYPNCVDYVRALFTPAFYSHVVIVLHHCCVDLRVGPVVIVVQIYLVTTQRVSNTQWQSQTKIK